MIRKPWIRFLVWAFAAAVIATTPAMAAFGRYAGGVSAAEAVPLTFVVNTADHDIIGSCDAAHCSLREAIFEAVNNPGPDTITFNIPGAGSHVIAIGDAPGLTTASGDPYPDGLYSLSDGSLTIDATTQPGYAGQPLIEIRYVGASTFASGITLASANNVIKGLSVTGFANGILVTGSSATANTVEDNYIGVLPDGHSAGGNTHAGILIMADAGDTTIQGNLISGNEGSGIVVMGGAGNTIVDNIIGTTAHGLATPQQALPNFHGIALLDGTSGITISNNVISGNTWAGVNIYDGSHDSVLQNNLIGTDSSGSAAIPNGTYGVLIDSGAHDNLIGGAFGVEGNVISGNALNNIEIGGDAFNNQISGNLIGLNAQGTAALPDPAAPARDTTFATYGNGVMVFGAGNIIGGATPSERNVISGNGQLDGVGVFIAYDDAVDNQVLNNYIGLDGSGTTAIPNLIGVANLFGPPQNTLVEDNVISGNGQYGVYFTGDGTIRGNRIGTSQDGMSAVPNCSQWDGTGLHVVGSPTQALIENNLVSGNGALGIPCDGIAIVGSGSSGNQVLGNTVGLDASGGLLENHGRGIFLASNTQGNVVTGNIVAGGTAGIVVSTACAWNDASCESGGLTADNTLAANLVGADSSGAQTAGSLSGVVVFGAPDTLIQGNTIAYNGSAGVRVSGETATGVHITENSIFDNVPGLSGPGLGIDLGAEGPEPNDSGDGDAGPNLLINYPELDPAATTEEETSGTACAGCTVEVFMAAPDPSGYGEGKILVGTGTADPSGNFIISLTGVAGAVGLTATATDSQGNTSEFSPVTPVPVTSSLLLGSIWALLVPVVLGGLVGGIAWRRKRKPTDGIIGGLAGGAIGVALYAAATSSVSAPRQRTPEPPTEMPRQALPIDELAGVSSEVLIPGENDLFPPCNRLLHKLSPVDGAAFDPASAVELSWAFNSSTSRPSRFRIVLWDSTGYGAQVVTTDTSVSLDRFTDLRREANTVFWRIQPEEQIGGDLYAPICSITRGATFSFGGIDVRFEPQKPSAATPPPSDKAGKPTSPAPTRTPKPTSPPTRTPKPTSPPPTRTPVPPKKPPTPTPNLP